MGFKCGVVTIVLEAATWKEPKEVSESSECVDEGWLINGRTRKQLREANKPNESVAR